MVLSQDYGSLHLRLANTKSNIEGVLIHYKLLGTYRFEKELGSSYKFKKR